MGFFNIQPFGSENNEKYGNNKQNDFYKRKFFNTVSLSHLREFPASIENNILESGCRFSDCASIVFFGHLSGRS